MNKDNKCGTQVLAGGYNSPSSGRKSEGVPAHLDHVLDSAVRVFFYHRLDPDERLHLGTKSQRLTCDMLTC